MSRKHKDLTGLQFGRWIVLSEAEPKYDYRHHLVRYWNCECTCENHTKRVVVQDGLTSGNSTSCGCYKKEVCIKK